jgi:hypothetical protein
VTDGATFDADRMSGEAEGIGFGAAALETWHARLNAARGAAIGAVLAFAAECFEFSQACERTQGGSAYTSLMFKWFGINATDASRWAKVGARRAELLIHESKLPHGLQTLYLICGLPAEVIASSVTASTTQREARKLLRAANHKDEERSERKKRKAEATSLAERDDDGSRQASLGQKIADKFGDGDWHDVLKIAQHFKAQIDPVRALLKEFLKPGNAYGVALCERRVMGRKGRIRDECRILRTGKLIDVGMLMGELAPLLADLEAEARKRVPTNDTAADILSRYRELIGLAHKIKQTIWALAETNERKEL